MCTDIDEQLDEIYSVCDDLMRNGSVDTLNTMLDRVSDRYLAGEYNDDIAIGYLTATLPMSTKLPSRDRLFNIINSRLGENELRGL